MDASSMRVEHRVLDYNPALVLERQVLDALISATRAAGVTIFTTGSHSFYPQGFSAFVILGESHTAVHTFPESGEVWVEIASCSGDTDFGTFFQTFEGAIVAE